jgi:hypothetical protein
VFGGFIGQKPCHLGGQFPEILGGNIFFTHQSQFMLDEGMIPHKNSHKYLLYQIWLGMDEDKFCFN